MYSKKMQVVPPRRRSFLGFGDDVTITLSPPFVGPNRSPPFAASTSVLTSAPTALPADPASASPIAGIPPYVLLGGAALVAYFMFGRK